MSKEMAEKIEQAVNELTSNDQRIPKGVIGTDYFFAIADKYGIQRKTFLKICTGYVRFNLIKHLL